MVDKFYVPYMEESASDWSPYCVVKYEDYAALGKNHAELSERCRRLENEILKLSKHILSNPKGVK